MEAGRVGEVCCVGVSFESDIGVCGILRGEVRGEVVEATIMGLADEGDASEELLGG